MLELQYNEPKFFDYVCEQIRRVPETLASYLSDARDAGRLRADAEPVALSLYIITILRGLRMLSRTSADGFFKGC
mgnify:CR=1 FL=1